MSRKQRCWSCSRAAGGSSPGRGTCCRRPIRPQKSSRGEVQPHPGLSATKHPLLISPHLWTFYLVSFLKTSTPRSCVCAAGILRHPADDVLLHPEVHCFDTSFLKTVFYLLVCSFYFDRSTLCILVSVVERWTPEIRPARKIRKLSIISKHLLSKSPEFYLEGPRCWCLHKQLVKHVSLLFFLFPIRPACTSGLYECEKKLKLWKKIFFVFNDLLFDLFDIIFICGILVVLLHEGEIFLLILVL